MQLRGKTALVTGGARRVGRVFAEQLAEAGARVVIHYHQSRIEAERLAQELDGEAVGADLSVPQGVDAVAEVIEAQGRELGVIINSAAQFVRTPFAESSDELWQRTMQLVVLSPASLTRRLAPRMSDNGLILNILDVAATVPWANYAHHSVAKAALLMLTRCLALELGPRLRVGAITPGVLRFDDRPLTAIEEKIVGRLPLKRPGGPEDLRAALRYFLDGDYSTGAVLNLDGGWSSI